MTEEIYALKNVPIFEAMYGKHLISLGGYEAIDDMFSGTDLKNQKILDIGSGIGGMAYHLAEKHGALVTGLELYGWMPLYASERTPSKIKDKVNFICYDENGSIPLLSESLNIACSKGVLTNVEDKTSLFKEIFRTLKPSGQMFLIDWIVPEDNGPKYEQLQLGDMSFKETASSYKAILQKCGFKNISFEDKSDKYLGYVRYLVSLLRSDKHKEEFSSIIPPELREEFIKSEIGLQTDIETGKQISVLIKASA